jgi:hypothetical protein
VIPAAFLMEIEERFEVMPMTGRLCVRALGLAAAYPTILPTGVIGAIGATALVEGIPFVTADAEMQGARAIGTIG